MATPQNDLEMAVTDAAIEETTTADHIQVIQTVIASLDADNSAMVSQTPENGHLWKFKYAKAEVFVQLTGLSDDDTLTVWSMVLKLPAKNEAKLMRQLLEMNWSSTFEARFGIIDQQVVVVSTRTLAELSPGEISRLLTVVATIANDHEEALQSEFAA